MIPVLFLSFPHHARSLTPLFNFVRVVCMHIRSVRQQKRVLEVCSSIWSEWLVDERRYTWYATRLSRNCILTT